MSDASLKRKISQLRMLDHSASQLRRELGFSHPGTVIWKGDTWGTVVVVEADGYGGAFVREVTGNFPVDFEIVRESRCDGEAAACRLARSWVEPAGETPEDGGKEVEKDDEGQPETEQLGG